jgi:predicted ABC-type ATPase
MMLEEIRQCKRRGDSFGFETTLAGLSYLRHIQQWQLKGYRVSLSFLTLPNVETAIARVAERVRQGGHNIPEPVIRRRFYSGWRNFTNTYRAAVDDWAVYDNSGNMPVLVEWGEAQ